MTFKFGLFTGSPVLGYLAAGVLIGPYALSIIRNVHGTKAIAEFGVVFLLFNIGLEVSMGFNTSISSFIKIRSKLTSLNIWKFEDHLITTLFCKVEKLECFKVVSCTYKLVVVFVLYIDVSCRHCANNESTSSNYLLFGNVLLMCSFQLRG